MSVLSEIRKPPFYAVVYTTPPKEYQGGDFGGTASLLVALAAVQPGDYVITLDVQGKRLSTEKLAQQLEKLLQQGNHVALLIGGPEGLAPQCRNAARESWSLSDLTLPHPLVRVLIAEQLYRAWSILKGHPYHR